MKTKSSFLLVLPISLLALTAPAAVVWQQGFETDTSGWFSNGNGPPNRVASGNNSINAFAGNYYATVNGNPPFLRGGAEYNGAYTMFGTDGNGTVFPAGGFQTSIAIYLDVANTSYNAADDTRFDWDVALNTSSGGFLRDFVFNAGYYTANGGEFVISAGNNAGRENSFPANPGHDPITITLSGWYTFNDDFTMVGGVLQDDMTVDNASGGVIGTWINSTPGDTDPGGVAYGWFPQQGFNGLAIDQATLSETSAVPEPTTIIAGASMLLPFGAGTLRMLRKKIAA